MYSPNINMVISSDKIIAFRFLSSQKSNQSSWDLLMIRFARLPAAFVAAAIGPGRSGLRRCCQGELACLTSASIRGREARSGLRVRWSPSAGLYIFKTSYFESSQSCRERAACFSILVIRLAPISSSRCELGIIIEMSPLAMTSCLDPG